MNYWNISIGDVTPCFACEGEDGVINDVHHIENKKSGGDPQGLQDRIDNLIFSFLFKINASFFI